MTKEIEKYQKALVEYADEYILERALSNECDCDKNNDICRFRQLAGKALYDYAHKNQCQCRVCEWERSQ